ncbi:MAG TPA: hypothetical protein VJ824_14955, partial [Bacillota bacterium]|nr:hypothetical protein [Bacillota bacterium]
GVIRVAKRQASASLLPIPSTWRIVVSYGGRPTSGGELKLNTLSNQNVSGTLNFRGVPIPVQGIWNEQTNQIQFRSPYAVFSGRLSTYREPGINHYMLQGNYASTVGSNFPGAVGNWEATTATFHSSL